MSELGPITAPSAITGSSPVQATVTDFSLAKTVQPQPVESVAFADMLSEAVAQVDGKVAEADRMVGQFAIDPSTPIHHVTIALEEARLAVELATQVRQRMTEGYRELMNMQL